MNRRVSRLDSRHEDSAGGTISTRRLRFVELAVILGIIAGSLSWQASPANSASAATLGSCKTTVSRVAHGYGAPDDLAILGGKVVFGDIKAGVVARIDGGRVTVLVRHLNVPEGIAVLDEHDIVVVEQGYNRLDTINLSTGSRRVLLRLTNNTGQEGVDSITRIGSSLIIPNSPYGTVLRYHAGHLTTLATGMSRPTSAVAYGGGLAVADENANAVWLVKRGHVPRLASVPTPDDVAVVNGMLVAVTLGDGKLWEIRPRQRVLAAGFNQPQGLVTTGRRSVAIAASDQNAIFRVSIGRLCW